MSTTKQRARLSPANKFSAGVTAARCRELADELQRAMVDLRNAELMFQEDDREAGTKYVKSASAHLNTVNQSDLMKEATLWLGKE